ncbi:hypothetical protein [Asticcacaulis sp. AC402]|uniref:hypothetical protein n=1 Tax=Asticcacaulis sp. AC402 TaxID=1282361 RepID=UPI0003C3E6C9|nr:hypothetical protein [Asticcacaulis sp. AC402]ESQ74736.1 hypothetical protein ABAC402_12585 [Asticcacaulis sp. AC402]
MSKLPFLITAILATAAAGTAHGQSMDLFGPQTYSTWVDIRARSVDGERSWLDGGFGKLRTGGDTSDIAIAQAVLLWTPRFSDTIIANVFVQGAPDANPSIDISEAYIKWKPVPTSATRFSLRVGRMFAPLSQEHDGPGWTLTRTLTPSVINSWVGEELLVDGVEANVQSRWRQHGLGATLGLYGSSDTAGTLLAFRGWAQHDLISTGHSKLPLPLGNVSGFNTVFTQQATISRPAVEVDGRLGHYVRLDWRPPSLIAFHLSYLHNPGKTTLVENGQYGWATRLVEGGFQAQLSPGNTLLGQALTGTTQMGGLVNADREAVDIRFDAAYIMLSHAFDNASTLSLRADSFKVTDRSWMQIDNNNEKGRSVTVAWIKPLNDHLSLGVEAVHIDSRRPSRQTQSVAERQHQTLIQVSVKIRP